MQFLKDLIDSVTKKVTPSYITLSLNTPLFRNTQIDPHVKQKCGQANVNCMFMKNVLVSTPSIAEQCNIITKVDELMKICNQLKSRIKDTQQTQLNLADAIVEKAV